MNKKIAFVASLILLFVLFSGCTQITGGTATENATVTQIKLDRAIKDCEKEKTEMRIHHNEYVYKSIKGINAGLDDDMDELVGMINDMNKMIFNNAKETREDLNIINETVIDINKMFSDVNTNINDIYEMVEDLDD